MKALVAGATGLIGKELVKQLIEHPEYSKVIMLTRRKLELDHEKVEQKLINFDSLPNIELEENINVCFCCLGTTQKKSGKEGMRKVDYEYVVNLAQLCKNKGIQKLLIISSIGANAKASSFYLRTKGQMEEAVAKVRINTVHILQPSLLVGDRGEFRIGEWIGFGLFKIAKPFMQGKLLKYRAVSDKQVAQCFIDMANKNEGGFNIVESDVIQEYDQR